jgi:hypothetical protein
MDEYQQSVDMGDGSFDQTGTNQQTSFESNSVLSQPQPVIGAQQYMQQQYQQPQMMQQPIQQQNMMVVADAFHTEHIPIPANTCTTVQSSRTTGQQQRITVNTKWQ